MLAISDDALAEKLEAYRKADTQKTLDKNSAVEEKYNH
jgi:phosphoribosylcarboxyaminoimidazole (NCAIR) mutase